VTAELTSTQIGPISPAGSGPLYQQIIDGIRREVSAGRLAPGVPLPSFRTLAGQLMVSLITVKRAYEELEREGVIRCHPGLGTFVAERSEERVRQAARSAAEAALGAAVASALNAGLSYDDLSAALRREWELQSRQQKQ
jgi:GntR family transcriptional regulator